MLETLSWIKPHFLKCIDQTKLPCEKKFLICRTRQDVYSAIKTLAVRGAPAIGVAGAYGICVDIFNYKTEDTGKLKQRILNSADYLISSRPTAVNLSWAVKRICAVSEKYSGNSAAGLKKLLLDEARLIHYEDRELCRKIGENGVKLIKNGMKILTHCNAGILATGGGGTALSVLYEAKKRNKKFSVYADETRPLLQGARLTAYELSGEKIDVTLICDSMAGFLMKQKKIDLVITGADRIARNGDTANKIGTFSVAKLAYGFKIPFYIAAPYSTFDYHTRHGKDIIIEERPKEEVLSVFGKQIAPANVKVYNPAFDVTDACLIKGYITEKGILSVKDLKEYFKKDIAG